MNEFLSSKDRRKLQADYERSYKQYEKVDQPKVTAIDATINIYPERRSFDGLVKTTLQNKTAAPLKQVHITNSVQSVSNIQFDRAVKLELQGPRQAYWIYSFEQALAPGETTVLTCNVGHETRGFRDGNEIPQFAYNGTFFDGSYLPQIGYDNGNELDDPRRRREEHLPELEDMRPREDPRYSRLNLFTGQQSDWITYHTVVSTSSDQIAISPGYLQKEWSANNRRYFEYSMGSTHIQDFMSWISGRYAVKREPYKGINIEVYYDPKNAFNIDDMIAASKAGLDYNQANYSPYQFSQYRIMEFPRYRGFAQSFPNTVPFSESIGFIGRMEKKTDIDYSYFVTAHELGHQWWGHQLIGGMVQGSNMMSESLAEYTALRIMARKYGEENMRKFLKHELDGYLSGRSGETRHEPPLALVQREQYVWYQKGSIILYALSDYIGEDKLNQALGEFLRQYRYANANNQVDAVDNSHASIDQPYPDTREFVAALRSKTPPELQYFIDDSFDNITLYGNGKETPVGMNDFIDIGVTDGKGEEAKMLRIEKHKLTGGKQTFQLTVASKPVRAGIDPYNKLIDRNSEDNLIDVTEQ